MREGLQFGRLNVVCRCDDQHSGQKDVTRVSGGEHRGWVKGIFLNNDRAWQGGACWEESFRGT